MLCAYAPRGVRKLQIQTQLMLNRIVIPMSGTARLTRYTFYDLIVRLPVFGQIIKAYQIRSQQVIQAVTRFLAVE